VVEMREANVSFRLYVGWAVYLFMVGASGCHSAGDEEDGVDPPEELRMHIRAVGLSARYENSPAAGTCTHDKIGRVNA
jgi:hypothetical protein